MTEFELIKIIRRLAGKSSSPVVLGIGDDCAAIKLNRGEIFLHTTDCLVEDVHFKRKWCGPEDIGWKAVAVNLSDIASMGGEPVGFLLTLMIPTDADESYIGKIVKGAIACGRRYGASLIGGNISSITGPLVVDISMIGKVDGKRVLKRSGARSGDIIFISGNPGCSSAGMKILESGDSKIKAEYKKLVQAHLRPVPRLGLAGELAGSGYITSMIDISDGLVQDLGHICEESGVDAELDLSKIKPLNFLEKYCSENGIDTVLLIATGGEDYEILFTANQRNKKRIEAVARKYKISLMEIGIIIPSGKKKGVQNIALGYSHKLF